jgi:hypothetical protein
MATRVILIDDLDGESEADESLDFALQGDRFEIDLSGKHAAEMRDVLQPYLDAARKVAGSPKVPTRSAMRRRASKNARAWVRQNGWDVTERGRIPKEAMQAWEDAGSPAAAA